MVFNFFLQLIITAADSCIRLFSTGIHSATLWCFQECVRANMDKIKLYRQYKRNRINQKRLFSKELGRNFIESIWRHSQKILSNLYLCCQFHNSLFFSMESCSENISFLYNSSPSTVFAMCTALTALSLLLQMLQMALGYTFASCSNLRALLNHFKY